MEKFTDYLKEKLQNEEVLVAYINEALEQYSLDHNKELFLATLKEAIIARGGVAKISEEAHINRQHIYKMLSSKGNPSFDNIGSLLNTLGLQLKVETRAACYNNTF
ncbi:putative transcriptional regulator [Rickettsia felis str. Pedreira]|uniref:Predicted transcriptional regulator n=2 Tax=Rickettsia felis TaxID=42862 RepID=Q4UJX2_RICFE|nr:transcriptional regulator [Rickettsia felis]AAY62167.1 Predicted transcriptional regulator [Rickettsia felis URRWXCal2]KHO02336.1 transcriptional regulator [Rickettsia felis str. LSU]KHO02473.1 transcriptional regulator [Rickettsia felis]KJV58650.1 putative transcriptional regulator [Rickettsia felis str. Pedreira]MDE8610740.1 transcriptional regulator [Rickettsia felis]